MNRTKPAGTDELLAHLLAGLAVSPDLIDWAVQALADGYSTPSLLDLACARLDSVRLEDTQACFRKALDELGIVVPEPEQVLRNHFRRLAEKIVEGQIAPRKGLARVDREVNAPLQWPRDLEAWDRLAEGLDYPSFREIDSPDELDRIIVDKARKAIQDIDPLGG